MAGRPERVAALTRSFEQGARTIVQYQDERDRAIMAGAQSFAEQKYDDAVRSWKQSNEVGDCIVCGQVLVALAYDRAGKSDSALVAYQRFVDQPDYLRFVTDPAYLAHSLQRLGELYEAKGDVPNAVKYYREFLDLWKRADPELQPRVAEVRRRISRLGDIETPRR